VPATLDPAAFPNMERLGAAIATCDFATEYARGLEILIAAVRAAAKRRPRRLSSARRR